MERSLTCVRGLFPPSLSLVRVTTLCGLTDCTYIEAREGLSVHPVELPNIAAYAYQDVHVWSALLTCMRPPLQCECRRKVLADKTRPKQS